MSDRLIIDGVRLECRWWGHPSAAGPVIVLLHEGLGSMSLWRDFPKSLAERTGSPIFAYSRQGYGASDVVAASYGPDYMHLEAERVLPAVLAAAGIKRPILLGHSDGASIALIYAGRFPGAAQGLILEAPHVFVEPLTRASIAAIKSSYGVLDLSRKLARHHRDPDFTFWRWNDIWLDARFADWNIEVGLEAITGPVLMIQGEDDEYGTVAQLAAIRGKIPRAQSLMLADCGHAPHRDQPVAVLAAVEGFVTAPAD